MVGLVWVADRLARSTGRRDPLTRIGVPLLVAVFPQDALYAISNDALAPLLTALALVLILRMHAEPPRLRASLLAGLVTAAAILVKYTNCVVLIPAVVLTGMTLRGGRARLRGWLRCNALFWIAVFTPIAAWGARNAALFGDPTARRLIFETMGWRPRPLGTFLDHPLFSLPGLLHFLDGLCRDFWRGRFKWGGEIMSDPAADFVYVVTSGVLLTVATLVIARELVKWLRSRRLDLSPELRVDLGAWLTLVGGVLLLAFFSVWIETGVRSVPPRDDPFFTMGRLISGCIVPFALLYVRGLGAATAWISGRARALVRAVVFGLVVAVVVLSESRLSMGPVRSEYNWFHLESVEYGPCAATPRWRTEKP
jgi:4-amino-4-deoxy-L-arabinose transferase-like glycosyltransferase